MSTMQAMNEGPVKISPLCNKEDGTQVIKNIELVIADYDVAEKNGELIKGTTEAFLTQIEGCVGRLRVRHRTRE